jgi:CheY-like chemotaxis protein
MPNLSAVLIVENDDATRHLLEALVRRNHFQPTLSGDGKTALQSLESNDFDVILLDLLLPELDGRDPAPRALARHAPRAASSSSPRPRPQVLIGSPSARAWCKAGRAER